MRNLLTLLAAIFISCSAFAQLSFNHRHYSVHDGLSENNITVIFQDSRGFLWFGTSNGLNRFDGYEFRPYKTLNTIHRETPLVNDHIVRITEDTYGFLWISTYEGRLYRFDVEKELFTTPVLSGEHSESFPEVTNIYPFPNGELWCICPSGRAVRILTDPNDQFSMKAELFSGAQGLIGKNLKTIIGTPDGKTLVIASDCVLRYREEEGRFEKIIPDHQLPTGVYPTAVSENTHGMMIGMSDGSIYRETGKDFFTLLDHPLHSEILNIQYLDPDHYMAYGFREGIVVASLNSGKTTLYPIPQWHPFRAGTIHRLYVDSHREIWFGSGNEWVYHINPATGEARWLNLPASQNDAASRDTDFFETTDGILFIRLGGNRGCYYNREEKRLEPLVDRSENSPFVNNISRWYPDRQGNIWISTFRREIEKISLEKRLRLIPLDEDNSLEQNDVHCLLTDHRGRIWIGTRQGKVCLLDRDYKIRGYLDRNGILTAKGEVWPRIYAIEQDREGDIWLGTRGDGLFRLKDLGSGQFSVQHYPVDPLKPNRLNNGHIFTMHTDSHGRMWIGTWGGGVNYMEKDVRGEPVFRFPGETLAGYPMERFSRIRHIVTDQQNRLWCASPFGVITFSGHPDSLAAPSYITLNTSGAGSSYLPVNNVNSMLCTSSNDVFIGTTGGGMYQVMRDSAGVHELRNYSSLNGFPSDIIYAMTEDNEGLLWISTAKGIVRFNPDNGETDLYGNDHYDPYSMTSNTANYVYGRDVLLGSNKGLVVFSPERMVKDTYVPPLYFTALHLFNQEVIPGGEDDLLDVPLAAAEKLTFNHKQNVFNISFAALDYRNPEKIRYQYMLDRFDREWNDADVSRSAAYTNLPAGNYTLRVRSTNSDGVWADNEKQLAITVLPSFWKTPLAYTLYTLFALGLIFLAMYIMMTLYKLKQSVRVEQQMMRVFTNISHEIRTPLTLVHTPLEHILKTKPMDSELEKELQIAYRNSGRLLQLVNQLLDFRKIKHKKMPLMLHPLSISDFIRDLVQNFQSLAKQKNIHLHFQSNCPEWIIQTDREKIETIFYNLISNALKYTPAGRSVYVEAEQKENELCFTVRDEGIGIAKERMGRLFIPFESGGQGPNDIQPGTGIGLTLVKELCNLLDMEIDFESKSGTGTTVTLKMKVSEPVSNTETEIKKGTYNEQDMQSLPVSIESVETETNNRSISEDAEENWMKKVLVVEDNPDLRQYLRRLLRPDHEVSEACNGKIGLEKARDELPDLIISDLMMPVMDGFEFTAKLKDDIKTSHIPVIILTAKSDPKIQAQLYRLGVDAFITKPFDSQMLQTRIESILRQRERLHATFSSSLFAVTNLKKEANQTSSRDQECIDKLMGYLEENLSSSDITVDDLCSVSGFTYSLLYKKLKTLIGLSPLEFIREFRIQRAAELIVEGRLSMKEVAYMVGFSDSRYFSRSFKQKYGITPSEYKTFAQGKEIAGMNIRSKFTSAP